MHELLGGRLKRAASPDAPAASGLILTRRGSPGTVPLTRHWSSRPGCIAFWLALGVTLGIGKATAQQHIAFIGVASDQEYYQADAKLCDFLQKATQRTVDRQLPENYGAAIRTVTEWRSDQSPYLARLTPYAYVAAEMLGAEFEILATYQSRATQSRTYHSYFVVNRERYRQALPGNQAPNLADLREYLRRLQSSSPPRFIYHDKFSTSSYFLPSLYFRAQRIFAMPAPTESLIAIDIRKLDAKSSSALVEEVAEGRADVAAVWDGTKSKYEKTPDLQTRFGSRVYFVQLPSVLPNDLLVASASLEHQITERIHTAIPGMKSSEGNQINVGDFAWWEDIREASDAREALAGLRRDAAAPPAPVPVRVEESTEPALQKYIQAARQAVRLSGTEFVLFDRDLHKHVDVSWTLRLIHDGAVILKSDFQHSQLSPQEFSISFTSPEDLTVRIGAIIHSRLHRIRYIWPYEERTPTVIRDVDFVVPARTRLEAQKINWVDPGRNEFTEGDIFEAEVEKSDFYKFRLKDSAFPRRMDRTFDFEPMSNAAYRVVLVRPSRERPWLKAMTVGFVVLLILAATAAVLALRRRPSELQGTAGALDGAMSR